MLSSRAKACRLQAEQARRDAETVPHSFEKELFLQLADDWERAADNLAKEHPARWFTKWFAKSE